MGSVLKSTASIDEAKIKVQPILLGAGILFSVLLNTLRYFTDTITEFSSEQLSTSSGMLNNYSNTITEAFSLQPFVFAIGWGVILGAILLLAVVLLTRKAKRTPSRRAGVIGIIVSAVLVLFGLAYLMPLYANITLPFIEPTLFGFAFGAGMVILCVAWGALFAQLEPANLLFNTALNVILGAILHFSGELLSPSLTGLAFIGVSLLASVALLVHAYRTLSFNTTPEQELPPRRERVQRAIGILWMPLIGACITCFIFGLTWDPIASSEPLRSDSAIHTVKILVGPVGAAGIIAFMVARKPRASTLRLLNQAIYPIAVALLLALPVVIVDDAVISSIVELLKPASFSIIVLAIWFSMANAVRSVPLSATLSIPICLVLLALSFVGGLYGIAFIGTSGRTICLVILTIYLLLITISFALGNKNQKESQTEPGIADSRTYIQRRCDELATEQGLSPREREVLYYLGRGYNHGFVAQKLYISENTVRTHVRHIYTKLEIGSREELLEMIDRPKDESAQQEHENTNAHELA